MTCCQADEGNFDDCQVYLPMLGIMMNGPPSPPQEVGGDSQIVESGEIDLSESSSDMSGSFDSQISFFTLVTMAAIVFLSRK